MFNEEAHAMYLLVEIRKLIEYELGELRPEYGNIKFYCDWAMHTAKSRSFQGLEETFELIYQDCKRHIEDEWATAQSKGLINFLYFTELQKHLLILYEQFKLPKKMLEDDSVWISFIMRLLGILTDQPITNIPNKHIKEICVIGASERTAAIRVYFTKPVITPSGKPSHYYQLGNAF